MMLHTTSTTELIIRISTKKIEQILEFNMFIISHCKKYIQKSFDTVEQNQQTGLVYPYPAFFFSLLQLKGQTCGTNEHKLSQEPFILFGCFFLFIYFNCRCGDQECHPPPSGDGNSPFYSPIIVKHVTWYWQAGLFFLPLI